MSQGGPRGAVAMGVADGGDRVIVLASAFPLGQKYGGRFSISNTYQLKKNVFFQQIIYGLR